MPDTAKLLISAACFVAVSLGHNDWMARGALIAAGFALGLAFARQIREGASDGPA